MLAEFHKNLAKFNEEEQLQRSVDGTDSTLLAEFLSYMNAAYRRAQELGCSDTPTPPRATG